jgi:hypothetical protein
MNVKLLSATGFVAAALALGQAPASAAPSCLQIGQIYSWNAPDNKTLIVEDNWHQKWKLSLMGPCINLTFKERVGFQSIGGFGGLTCLSKGDNVLVRNPGFPQRCPIVNIVPYTPQMEAADKAAAAAKKAQQNGP